MRTARPFSTVVIIAHVSGQSCGHAPRTVPLLTRGRVVAPIVPQTYSGDEGEPFLLHHGPNSIQRGTLLTDGPAHDDTHHHLPFARLGFRLWRPRRFHDGCATGIAGRGQFPGGAGASTR